MSPSTTLYRSVYPMAVHQVHEVQPKGSLRQQSERSPQSRAYPTVGDWNEEVRTRHRNICGNLLRRASLRYASRAHSDKARNIVAAFSCHVTIHILILCSRLFYILNRVCDSS